VQLYFDKIKVAGKVICQAMRKKCDKEIQELAIRIKIIN